MKIYYEDNHILVVEKKPNQPTQEDSSKDLDMVTELKGYLKDKYQKPGNVYLGLVHRLDRPVGGVMVFAKTSKAASRLSDQVRTHKITKEYTAIIEGDIKPQVLKDTMVKNRKTNTSYVVKKDHPEGKYAELEILTSQYNAQKNLSRVTVDLKTGRSHQIRVQFSSRNHPLWGDARYNKHAVPNEQIALWATKLSFEHPTTKERMTFISHTPDSYPFTLW